MILQYPDTMFEAGITSVCSQERCLQIVLETMLVVFQTISVSLSLECRRCGLSFAVLMWGVFKERS
jgi:hypothetical protein